MAKRSCEDEMSMEETHQVLDWRWGLAIARATGRYPDLTDNPINPTKALDPEVYARFRSAGEQAVITEIETRGEGSEFIYAAAETAMEQGREYSV